jgi:hypothetical protein
LVTELKREIFDSLIERRWATSINQPIVSDTKDWNNEFKEYEEANEAARTVPNIEDTVRANGKLLDQQPTYNDKILHSVVSLQLEQEMSVGKVTKCAISPHGSLAGTFDENQYLDLSSLMGNSESARPT